MWTKSNSIPGTVLDADTHGFIYEAHNGMVYEGYAHPNGCWMVYRFNSQNDYHEDNALDIGSGVEPSLELAMAKVEELAGVGAFKQ